MKKRNMTINRILTAMITMIITNVQKMYYRHQAAITTNHQVNRNHTVLTAKQYRVAQHILIVLIMIPEMNLNSRMKFRFWLRWNNKKIKLKNRSFNRKTWLIQYIMVYFWIRTVNKRDKQIKQEVLANYYHMNQFIINNKDK